MGSDRNSYIGLFLIGVILFAWMYLNGPSDKEKAHQKFVRDSIALVHKQDSIASIAKANKPANTSTPNSASNNTTAATTAATTATTAADTINKDSLLKAKTKAEYGILYPALHSEFRYASLSNDLLTLTFSNKGGKICAAKLNNFKTSTGASEDDIQLFTRYYNEKINTGDKTEFFLSFKKGFINTNADVDAFAKNKIDEYTKLHTDFQGFKAEFPSSVSEYSSAVSPSGPAVVCQTPCDNVDFENGTQNGWYTYYATNNSTTAAHVTSAFTGGAAGAVTRSALDPTSGTDQVVITSGAGLDPIAGALIPVVCPTGGNYSVRLGDSTVAGAQVARVEQKFTVSAANVNFIFMYAVILENPSHNYFQQPYFEVQLLDKNGNLIAGCGQYDVVSAPGLPGYVAKYYAPDADTVYCKPWTTVYLPLNAYMGQCVTIRASVYDCALGGHFGYAYFDAACSPGISSNYPVVCNNNVILTAPAGAGTYQWSGPCIVGPSTNPTCSINCAGTYKCIITSPAGPSCADTLTITMPSSTSPAPTISSTTEVKCHGNANGAATVSVSGGTTPYTYNWTPSGGSSATASNLTAGTYTCTVTDVNGCHGTVSVTITQPAVLTATMGAPTEVLCNGNSTGSATVTAGGGTTAYTYAWTPSGGTNATASNLAAGSYTVTVTDKNGCTATASVTITQPTLLTATISSTTNVKCNGGATGGATVTAGGGVVAYTYSWAPSGGTSATATNLTAGTYTVTVTDKNGCTATATAVIGQPTLLTVSTNVTNEVSCNGGSDGSATATAGGGTVPYTYNWTPSGGTNSSINSKTAGTYTITVTDKNGCTATATAVITQPPVLTANISSSTPVSCNGGTNGSATVTAGGGLPAYTYNWAPSGGTGTTASNLGAGTYTVTVTDANGCSKTASVIITQPTGLTASISSNTPVKCNGGATGGATVTAGGGTTPYTYNWTPSGGSGATATNLTAGTYTITVKDADGCSATASVTITQPTLLTASISASTPVSCNGGATGSATVTAGGGTVAYTYAWAPGGQTNATATNLTAATYTVTVTDKNGCTATASVAITQPPALTASISGSTNVSCNAGSDGSATVTAGGGTPAYTYSWAPGGQTNTTATGLTAGTYTITVNDNNGCAATASVVITQPTVLTANITATTNELCNGASTGSLTVTAGGGTTAYTYNWTPSGGTNATASNLSAGTYTITVTDKNGCTATASGTITQPTAITTTTGFVAATCGSSNGSANVTAGGGTGAYTYSWAPSGGTGSTATGLSSGSYTVTVKDANGCSVTAVVSVPNASGPVVTISGSTPVSCNGGSNGTATGGASGGNPPYTYNWTPSGGTNTTASGLTAGTYTLNVTDKNGCLGTASVIITQPAAIVVSVSSVTEVKCNAGATGKITVSAAGGTGAYTYAWTPSGGTNATASNLTAGTYTCTVKDANGCSGSVSVTITQPVVLAVTTTHVNDKCNGDANGSATATATGGTIAYTYAWTPSGGSGITATGLTAGAYTITVTDANGCTATAKVTITQPVKLTVTAVNTPVACNGGSNGTATATGAGGTVPYTYAWTPSGGTAATATGLTAGTYTITIKDKNGCSATASTIITQPTVLTASISSTTNVDCNGNNTGSTTVTAGGGTVAYTYSWAPSGGTNATASGLTAGTYTITVTDKDGCTATASSTITQPAVLTASISASGNVNCNGGNNGTATVTAGGGTIAYTYAWTPSGGTNPTASNLTAGTYTITVTDAHGCTATSSISITQPTVLTNVISVVSQVSCNGGSNGSAFANVNGGTLAYTYAWTPSGGTNPTANNLTAGTYTCTATDKNGCVTTASVVITQPTVLTASITATNNVSCNGASDGSGTVTAGGGTTVYTYNWAPGGATSASVTGLAPATYTVTVTDAHGCTATATMTITQPTVLTSSITANNGVSCNGNSDGSSTVTAGGGTVAYTYSWAPGGQTNTTATGLTAGTYTVTVTDKHGCTSQSTVTITQPVVLAVSINAPVPVSCNGGNNGSLTANPSGGTVAYTYAWSSGGTGSTESNLSSGTYTVTVTDKHGCTATASATITQPTALNHSISSNSPVSCNGGTNGGATVTEGGGTPAYAYTWTSGGGTNASASNLTAGSYTVYVTDANGCPDSATTVVTQPTALFATTGTTNSTCGKNNGTAAVFVSGGTSAYTYLWNPGGATSSTATGLIAGTYSVTITDANGCIDSAKATVTDFGAGTASINPTVNVTCFGGSNGSATVNMTGGKSPFTYAWSNGETNSTATGLTAGDYTVVVTDANGCNSTVLDTINQPTDLTIDLSATRATCGASNGTASVNPGGGTPGYTYAWSTGATTTTITGLNSGSYTLILTDNNGCADTASITVVNTGGVNPVIASSSNVTCNGGSNGSASVTVTGGTLPYTYNWTPSGGTSATATGLPTGAYTCNVTDSNGCLSIATVTITQPAPLKDSISFSSPLCSGGCNGVATANVSGGTVGYKYLWNTGATTVTISGLCTGSYTVTVTDTNNCTTTDSVTIVQPPLLKDTISSRANVSCNGGSDGSATVTASGGKAPYTYSWTNGATSATASNLSAGNYTVTVTDSNGCAATDTLILTQPAPVIPVITGIDTICTGGNTTLTAGAAANYLWSTGATTSSITVSPASNTTYTVVEWSGTCRDSTTVNVVVNPKLVVTMNKVDSVCLGKSVQIGVTVSGGLSPYNYAWNNGLSNSPGLFTIVPVASGYYVCDVTDACGSNVADSTYVFSSPSVKAGFKPTPDTIAGGEFISFINLSTGGNAWYWTFGDGGNSVDSFPYHQYLAAGYYVVSQRVSNSLGCVDSISDTVYVVEKINIPNVFTPNGDGVNDVFHIQGSSLKTFSIEIYNRWGQEVFTSTDPNIDWTGRSNSGLEESAGTYFYILKATSYGGTIYDRRGFVELIR